MKINQIISETTTAGVIATVNSPLGATQSRGNPSIYGGKKVGSLFKGKKTKAPYANSINESAEISEADLSEQDLIVVPGQGRSLKTGFVKHDPDRAEHEGQTLKNSLHTIIRVASHLDKELSTRDNFPEWVSEKIGATKSMMVSVMDYLISAKEMQHDTDAIDEGIEDNPVANAIISHVMKHRPDLLKHGADRVGDAIDRIASRVGNVRNISPDNLNKLIKQVEYYVTSNNHDMYEGKRNLKCVCKTHGTSQCPVHSPKDIDVLEGAKVDRMVKHVAQSEKKLGHSKKEAESIAWATANKRGMLDNKNKKK
jgi:hypothetical protein